MKRKNYTIKGYTPRTPQEKGQTFEVMISTNNYQEVEKNNLKEALKTATFEKHNITVEQFISFVDRGHIYTPLYNNDVITSKERNIENFVGTNIVSIDVDKSDISTQEVQRALKKNSIEPTFIYNTLSHNKEKNGIVCERYRLGYIFNKCLLQGEFYATSRVMVDKVKEVLGDKIEVDTCSVSPNQLYFGGNVFSFQNGKKPWKGYMKGTKYNEYINEYNELSNTTKAPTKTNREKHHQKVHRVLYENFNKYSRKQFLHIHGKKYKYICRVEGKNWINDTYQKIERGTYFRIPFYGVEVKDGQQRRKKLFQQLALKRYICPELDIDDLFVNAVFELRQYNNDDKIFTSAKLEEMCNGVLEMSIEDIYKTYKKSIQMLQKQAPKGGIIVKRGLNVSKVKSEILDTVISLLYEENKTIEENLQMFEDNDIKVSERRLKVYLKKYNIKYSDKRKLEIDDKTLISMLDKSLSVRKNKQMLEDRDIFVSLGKIHKLLTVL